MSNINIVVCAEKTEYKVALKNKITSDELSIIGYADLQPDAKVRIQGFVPDVAVFVLGFDGRGNFACGIKEQIIFPEIDFEKVDAVRGMDVCFVTTAKTDEEGKELLKALGAPFATENN